jgi:PEGA domain
MWLVVKVALCSSLLVPAVVAFQSPGFSGGRLAVTSEPAGAKILVDDRSMPQLTNFTYSISAGKHTVSVKGGPGNLDCSDKPVSVSAGGSVTVLCSKAGWE